MNPEKKRVSLTGIGLVFGCAFGYIIGGAIGNAGLGIALGTAFGLLFAPVAIRKEKTAKPLQ